MTELDTSRFVSDPAFLATSGRMKSDVQDVMFSGNYPVTPAVCRELKHIENGVDLIKLDQHFKESCQSWGNKFDPQTTLNDRQARTGVLGRTGNALSDFKTQMTAPRAHAQSDKQHGSIQTLRSIQEEMAPHAYQSVEHLRQFCDHMGVTDRYTGYRSNLSRGSRDPVRLGFSWLDDQNKNKTVTWKPSYSACGRQTPANSQAIRQAASAPPATTGYQYNCDMRDCNVVCKGDPHFRPNRSIQEQCGINMTFPGHTEYTQRYSKPITAQSTPDYLINPRPEFSVYGRPLARILYEKSNTEYQTRYEWPDGSKITKLPWLRK